MSRPHRSAAVLPSHSWAGAPFPERSRQAPLRSDRTGSARANRFRSVKRPGGLIPGTAPAVSPPPPPPAPSRGYNRPGSGGAGAARATAPPHRGSASGGWTWRLLDTHRSRRCACSISVPAGPAGWPRCCSPTRGRTSSRSCGPDARPMPPTPCWTAGSASSRWTSGTKRRGASAGRGRRKPTWCWRTCARGPPPRSGSTTERSTAPAGSSSTSPSPASRRATRCGASPPGRGSSTPPSASTPTSARSAPSSARPPIPPSPWPRPTEACSAPSPPPSGSTTAGAPAAGSTSRFRSPTA